MRNRRLHENENGMTLIEIIVVIILISLVFGVVARGVIGKGDEAKGRLNVVRMEKVKAAVERYRLEYNSYPEKLQDLLKASSDVKKSGKFFAPLIEEDETKDIFGFPLVYKTENGKRSFSLTSLGSDGVPGGEGAKQDVTVRP